MTARTLIVLLLFGTLLLPAWRDAQAQEAHFLKGNQTVSAPVAFFLSDQGRDLLRQSSSPLASEALKLFHGEASAVAPAALEAVEEAAPPREGPEPMDPGIIPAACPDATDGTKFNLEPVGNALSQNEEPVDFIRNVGLLGVDLVVGGANDFRGFIPVPGQSTLGSSATGYYVSRAGDSNPEFEGGLPPIDDPLDVSVCNPATGLPVTGCLRGGGDPIVAADPARRAFFFTDLRFDASTTAIGVFRNTVANLNSGVVCPAGTHTLAQANTCFTGVGAARRAVAAAGAAANFQDKNHHAVDERAIGVGAGNVYITFTHFTAAASVIQLVNCSNSLAVCSAAPVTISGGDAGTQFSHVTVKTNGVVAITWINVLAPGTTFAIRHRQCTPPAVPGGAMACGPISTVHTETQALRFGGRLGGNDLRIATYPVHDHRIVDGANVTTVVWSRCKIPLFPPPPNTPTTCLDADVVMKEATAPAGIVGAPAWPAAFVCVDCSANDQIFPWARTDRTRNIIAIVYYTSVADVLPQHRLQVRLVHRGPGAAVALDFHTLTFALTDPCGDPIRPCFFFGDYIGVASRGNGLDGATRDYVSFTYNTLTGTNGGVVYPNSNNHLSCFDH